MFLGISLWAVVFGPMANDGCPPGFEVGDSIKNKSVQFISFALAVVQRAVGLSYAASREANSGEDEACTLATVTGNVRGCVEVWGRVHLRLRS